MSYEVQLEDRKKDEQQHSKKKVLAFHTTSDMDNSDDDEEEMAMLSRKFKRFLKQGKFKKNKDTNDNPTCFKCNKPGHIKKDCPLMKSKGHFKNFNKFNKKKKAFQATWDDSDSSSSDEEEATETANICFMAQEDEVQDYDELLEAFNELFNNFKNEKIKNKVLTKEMTNLSNKIQFMFLKYLH